MIELIKKGYKIDLNEIEKIDFVMEETGTKSEEDWEKVIEYIDWYTEESRKCYPNWEKEASFEIYFRYLKTFKDVRNRELFPKEDCYYLIQEMNSLKKEEKLLEIILSNYHERERYLQPW